MPDGSGLRRIHETLSIELQSYSPSHHTESNSRENFTSPPLLLLCFSLYWDLCVASDVPEQPPLHSACGARGCSHGSGRSYSQPDRQHHHTRGQDAEAGYKGVVLAYDSYGRVACSADFYGYLEYGCHDVEKAYYNNIKCTRPGPDGWLEKSSDGQGGGYDGYG